MSLVFIIYGISALMVMLAVWSIFSSNTVELTEKTNRHFIETAGLKVDGNQRSERRAKPTKVKQLLWRAGIKPKLFHVYVFIGSLFVMLLLVVAVYGMLTALLLLMLSVMMTYIWLWHRANRRVKAILFQLPLFLDQTLRALATGRSMEGALALAASETPDPLKEIFERVLRANRLGDDLGQSIQNAADLYKIQELYLVSLAIRVNRSYGSSVRDLLNNIVKIIHDREAARRELSTLTGETRVTAWVLGLLPIMIAGYIMLMNPGYMLVMWEDAGGKIMLIGALLFQLTGAFILWRMIKSI